MASAALTLRVSNTAGVVAALKQYSERARARVRLVMDAHRRLVRQYAYDLCAVDTTWMREHTDSELTDEGYGFRVGYRPSDFIGQFNTYVTPPRLIDVFYPKYVIGGTRRTVAQDNLSPALEYDRIGLLDDLQAALIPRASDR